MYYKYEKVLKYIKHVLKHVQHVLVLINSTDTYTPTCICTTRIHTGSGTSTQINY
jgi:hypothetical protein